MRDGGANVFRSRLLGAAAALGMLAIVAVIAGRRYEPPQPRTADASEDVFSAARALPILETLVGDGIPHPVGSPQNAVVRGRITTLFEQWGYAVEVHEAPLAFRRPETVMLRNLIARRPGHDSTGTVVISAHHDSVPAGPGASDDGVGVAALLEIARMLAARPPLRNDVVFLITDGEEAGLLGARVFVDDHPLAGEIAAIVNLEARGTSGPSLMFETSEPNGWIVEAFAGAVERPVTSSLFFEVYRRMPRDTDLSVFKRHGLEGMNFAFIGDARNYHTANDTFENASRASLQHHGDNAWAMALDLGERDLTRRGAGNAVYFDLFAATVVRWPVGWTPLLAAAAALLVAIAILAALRARTIAVRPLAVAGGLWMLIVPGAALAALLTHLLLVRAGALGSRWIDRPVPVIVAFWLLAALWTTAVVSLRRGIGPRHWWAATWTWWAVISLALALSFPGASYLTLVPALGAGAAGLLAAAPGVRHSRLATAALALVPAAAAGCLWLPLERLFYDALGLGTTASAGVGFRAGMVMTAVAPLLAIRADNAAPPPGRPDPDG